MSQQRGHHPHACTHPRQNVGLLLMRGLRASSGVSSSTWTQWAPGLWQCLVVLNALIKSNRCSSGLRSGEREGRTSVPLPSGNDLHSLAAWGGALSCTRGSVHLQAACHICSAWSKQGPNGGPVYFAFTWCNTYSPALCCLTFKDPTTGCWAITFMEAVPNTLFRNMLTSGLLEIILLAFGSSPPAPSHTKKQTWNLLHNWCPSTVLSLCSGWSECLLHSLEIVLEQRFLRPQVRMCYSGGVWLSVQTWLSCRYHHMLAAGTKTLTEHKSKDKLRGITIFFLPLECTYCDFCLHQSRWDKHLSFLEV